MTKCLRCGEWFRVASGADYYCHPCCGIRAAQAALDARDPHKDARQNIARKVAEMGGTSEDARVAFSEYVAMRAAEVRS